MKKTFLTFFLTFVLLTPFTLFADVQYTILAPIPGTPISGSPTINEGYLSTYLNNLYMLGVALCTGLAVLMIVIGGIQWSGSGSWSGKTEGKERIQAALLGLLIALGSWVILNTINPDLLDTKLELKTTNTGGISTNPGGGTGGSTGGTGGNGGTTGGGTTNPTTPTGSSTPATGNKATIPSGIPVKDGAGNQIDSSMISGLQGMDAQLDASGIDWRVTEAYPPTRTHKSPCHQAGTCIDANFTGNTAPTAGNVNSFINAASSSGFRAVYEVQTQSQKNDLVAGGVPAANIAVLGSWISAPHFSVYNK